MRFYFYLKLIYYNTIVVIIHITDITDSTDITDITDITNKSQCHYLIHYSHLPYTTR